MKKITYLVTAFLLMTLNSISAFAGKEGQSYDAEHAASGGLPQFDPTWFPSQIFWLAITFLVLYVFFAKKALPTVASNLDARETRIRTDIEMAEKTNIQAEEAKSSYEETLQKAKDDASSVVAKAQESAKNSASDALDAFRKNQDKVLADLEADISKAKDKALDDMHAVAADTAKQAAAKIIDVDADLTKIKSVVEKLDKAA